MKHINSFNKFQQSNEGLKDFAIGAAMALSPLAVKSQDSKWINRSANANLHFWEKCKLAIKPDKSGSTGGFSGKSYKNTYTRLSDVSALDKDEKKKYKSTLPEGIEFEQWVALNNEAMRISAVLSDTRYDKFTDEKGILVDPSEIKDEVERQSMEHGIPYLEPYFVYYKPVFPKSRKITANDLLEYYKGLPGGLESFKNLVNSGYRQTEKLTD